MVVYCRIDLSRCVPVLLLAIAGLILFAPTSNAALPADAAENLALLKSTPYRNTNHDGSRWASVPSVDLPIDDFLVPWQDYRDAGGITRPIIGSGAFRVLCEFSHFAYDDPIIFPGQPAATHLHLFFGNTDANAFSTTQSLLDSGSSTCNGQELNRTAYWVPALIDAEGNVPVPQDALVYYKGYYGRDSDPGPTEVYPAGMRLVSGMSMASAPQPGHRNFRELFFRCYRPGTGGDNPVNTRSVTIPSCPDDSYLEMNVKFQTCWNGQDPADYRNNAAYSDVWPTSGSCPDSHPRKLPQMEYRVFFHDHQGSENWILSSDVSMADRSTITGRGYSLHGDWFGGWNRQVNQRWIDNCVNIVDTDCDEGLLADPRRNPAAKGLRIRPQYTATTRVPGAALLSDLCPVNKRFTGQTSVALCLRGLPDATTLLSPAGVVNGGLPTYRWNAVDTASDYLLSVTDADGNVVIEQHYSQLEAGCAAGELTCEVAPNQPVRGSLIWRVRTSNISGDGDWSEALKFRVNDAPAVSVRAGSITVVERTGAALVTVSLSAPATQTCTVRVSSRGREAIPGQDYYGASVMLEFAPGDVEKTISYTVLDDRKQEDDETFAVALANATGCMAAADGQVTIVDDDRAPLPQVNIERVSVRESAGSASVTVALSGASNTDCSVRVSSRADSATPGKDYYGATQLLTFRVGETEKTIRYQILDDTAVEAIERFAVAQAGLRGCRMGRDGEVTIVDD